MLIQGEIKFFNDLRGYGFIQRLDGEPDVFVHHTGLADPHCIPSDGARCEFEIGTDPKKGRPCAVSVRLI
jgi:CspA family cold shock protein